MNTTHKFKLASLKNEDPFDHQAWIMACEAYQNELDFRVIELTSHNWLEQIREHLPDACLLKPSGRTELYRELYQERVEILVQDLGLTVFPSLDELRIYENKKYFAYWAMARGVPHPPTSIFYDLKAALAFAESAVIPLVGKKNIGASGNGVRILKERHALIEYVKHAFGPGIVSRTGPKLEKGRILARIWNKLTHPHELANKLRAYQAIAADRQKGFIILQDFVPHEYEWRAVRIGDSFFAHKKLKTGDKASGTLLKDYGNPPLELLDFVYDLTETHGFHSVAVDLFEHRSSYLVNEIQCIFGQSDSYQMMVDGRIGRYVRKNGIWVFEEGDFAINACYDLRLEYLLGQLRNRGS